MAQITLTIPDNQVQRLMSAFSFDYVEDEQETKPQFAVRKLKEYIRLHVKNHVHSNEIREAKRLAEEIANDLEIGV